MRNYSEFAESKFVHFLSLPFYIAFVQCLTIFMTRANKSHLGRVRWANPSNFSSTLMRLQNSSTVQNQILQKPLEFSTEINNMSLHLKGFFLNIPIHTSFEGEERSVPLGLFNNNFQGEIILRECHNETKRDFLLLR